MNFPQDKPDFSDGYEYGIWFHGADSSDLHRWGFTEEEAREWLREWEEDIAPNGRPNIFTICRRPVGLWEVDVDGKYETFIRE